MFPKFTVDPSCIATESLAHKDEGFNALKLATGISPFTVRTEQSVNASVIACGYKRCSVIAIEFSACCGCCKPETFNGPLPGSQNSIAGIY
jgi:hypothetical protein